MAAMLRRRPVLERYNDEIRTAGVRNETDNSHRTNSSKF
jgi:hypothetical protein